MELSKLTGARRILTSIYGKIVKGEVAYLTNTNALTSDSLIGIALPVKDQRMADELELYLDTLMEEYSRRQRAYIREVQFTRCGTCNSMFLSGNDCKVCSIT